MKILVGFISRIELRADPSPKDKYSNNHLPFAHKGRAIKVVDCVVGIAVVVELNEGEAVLERNVPDPAKLAEELLHVAFAGAVRDATSVKAAGHIRSRREQEKR